MWLFPSLLLGTIFLYVEGLEYLGCYKESTDGPRLLSGFNQNFLDSLTPESCVKLCIDRGFRYAGLQSRIECYCDNELPPMTAISMDGCTSPCSGDERQICGGNWRFSLYYTGLQSVIKYVGCYKENIEDVSLMNGFQQNFLETLTPQKCISLCYSKGFRYAGTQSRVQCYCDNRRPEIKSSAHEIECNTHCSGNANAICGGLLRLSVYETGLEGPTLDTLDNYVGCFKDQEDSKILTGITRDFADNLTPERCVALCYRLGYLYAGLQNTSECQCGDMHPMPGGRAKETECSTNCSGDKAKLCGGEKRLSIYGTGITDIPVIGKLVGCFKDEGNDRLLDGHKVDLEYTNSPRRCVNICLILNFSFAGVENGKECFCGDKKPGIDLGVEDSHCNKSCSGDLAYNCGGQRRISIYRTGYIDNIVVPLANHFGSTKTTTPVLTTEFPKTTETSVINEVIENNNTRDPLVIPEQIEPVTSERYPSSVMPLDIKPITPSETNDSTERPTDTEQLSTPSATILDSTGTSGVPSDSCVLSETVVNGRKACKGETIFSESFTQPLTEKWQHTVKVADNPDFEFVVFKKNKTNAYISNGKLIIKPIVLSDEVVKTGKLNLEGCTGIQNTRECELEAKSYNILPPIQTARISTIDSFSFRYGIVDIRAKLPSGDWLVPELWLEPTKYEYGAEYSSGLVRIALSRGNRDLYLKDQNIGCKLMESGAMLGNGRNVRGRAVLRELEECWSNKYHNYSVIWTPENISFMVDGELKSSLMPEKGSSRLSEIVGFSGNDSSVWSSGSPIAPFDKDFHITLGLSVGGVRNFPDGSVSKGRPKPWKNFELKSMLNFWFDRSYWKSSWTEDGSVLEIEHIQVTAL